MAGITRVRTEGLLFEGGGGKATFSIEPDGLKGVLKGGVGVRRESIARPSGHGDFGTPSYRTGRRVSWSGLVETDSVAAHDVALEQLTGWASDGEPVLVMFDTSRGARWGRFTLDDEPDIQRQVYGRVSRYRIAAYSPDPVLFGEVRSFAGGSPMSHYGNFPATPVITVTGTGSAYTITSGSRVFAVTAALPVGQKDVIDMADGSVTRQGTRRTGIVGSAQTFVVPKGKQVSWSISGASAEASLVDSFI